MTNEIESVDLENSQAMEERERESKEGQFEPNEDAPLDVPEMGLNKDGFIDRIN